MNSWGNDYSGMTNQYGMPLNPMMGMMPNPMVMMPEMSQQMNAPQQPDNVAPLIGPVVPEGFIPGNGNADNNENAEKENEKHQRGSNRNDNRRDRDYRDRDRSRKRSRSRDRNDRSGNRSSRDDRGRRERRSKWDNPDNNTAANAGMNPGMTPGMNLGMTPGMNPVMNAGMSTGMNIGTGNMMMPGMMSTYNNMMGQGPMDMQNANMPHMGNMGAMTNMVPGMNMMHGMNMMPGMMDQNMMMMQQMQQNNPMPNQPIYVADGVLLPPVPGASTPKRREKPNGCRTIFIGGLPNGLKEEVIMELFQRFGNIVGVKLHKQGVCHVRYDKHECVEESFIMSGWRFRYTDQTDNEATTLFIDYALNREDQAEYERNKRRRELTPPRVEMYSPAALTVVSEKIKNDEQFAEVAPTLAAWLERGECNKKNSNTFYSLIQASNNQTRRLFNEKMTLDEDIDKMKTQLREKFSQIIMQFEHIAKILTAAKHQRVSDHFTKQQRRNIEMWLKMTEEVENMKEEFNALFDEDENERPGRNAVPLEKYEQLKAENENLVFEMESYKNELYLAKDEAERKFEKFKAHYIAQNALQNNNKQQHNYPPLPPPPMPSMMLPSPSAQKPKPPPPLPDDDKVLTSGYSVPPSEAKLISILTAFLLVHPLGATLEYLVSYVRSMVPNVTRATVLDILRKHTDVYRSVSSGVGSNLEHKWTFVTFDIIKQE